MLQPFYNPVASTAILESTFRSRLLASSWQVEMGKNKEVGMEAVESLYNVDGFIMYSADG